jgi:hypothetical protein
MTEYRVSLSSKDSMYTTRDGNEKSDNTVNEIDSMYLVMQPLLLTGQCVEMLTKLCLEYPVPLWGIFSLDVTLPAIKRITSYDSNFDNGEIDIYVYTHIHIQICIHMSICICFAYIHLQICTHISIYICLSIMHTNPH